MSDFVFGMVAGVLIGLFIGLLIMVMTTADLNLYFAGRHCKALGYQEARIELDRIICIQVTREEVP